MGGGGGRGWKGVGGVGEGGKGWEGVGYSRMKQLNECHYARLCKLTRATVLSISHAPWEHVFSYVQCTWMYCRPLEITLCHQ